MFDPAILFVLGVLVGIFLVEGDDLNQSVLIMLIVGFAIYSIGKAFYILRAARQVVVTGTGSYETFKEEFSFLEKDREMMDCIQ